MITSVHFKNFKVLRDAILPLGRFTLIVGPNGSGKSTALQALQAIRTDSGGEFQKFATAGLKPSSAPSDENLVHKGPPPVRVEVTVHWDKPYERITTTTYWAPQGSEILSHNHSQGHSLSKEERRALLAELAKLQVYSLDASAISAPVHLKRNIQLGSNGANLSGVLDQLRDREPERFETLNEELGRWLPEFDRVLFDVPQSGTRSFLLRMRKGHHAIPASDLSQGTLFAIAILTLAYLPDPPSIACFEEPDRGIHPRLLREVQDALYRLSHPESCGEKREPVQVIATTHSPYFLDLYRDHPEEVVIAHKTKEGGRFERLSEQPRIMEILGDAPLGEVWYSGILGGVPAEQ